MLEIAVSLKRARGIGQIGSAQKPRAGKYAGDVLAAQIAPAYWGPMPMRYMLIVPLDDPELEASMRAAGQQARAYPYAEYDDEGRMRLRSRVRVDWRRWRGTPALDPLVLCDRPSPPPGKGHLRRDELISHVAEVRRA